MGMAAWIAACCRARDLSDFIGRTPEGTPEHERDAKHYLEAIERAEVILRRGRLHAYGAALRKVRADSQDW